MEQTQYTSPALHHGCQPFSYRFPVWSLPMHHHGFGFERFTTPALPELKGLQSFHPFQQPSPFICITIPPSFLGNS